MMGSEQNRQSANRIKRKQPEQPLPPTEQKEDMKQVKTEEKLPKGNNPERELANYGVVTEFQKQMLDIQKDKTIQEKHNVKKEQKTEPLTKTKQTETENLKKSNEKEDSTIIGLIHSTEEMITGSIEKLKKLIDTSPQTLKDKTSTEVKNQNTKPIVVQTEDLLNLKTEQKGDASTQNKTQQVPFSQEIFQVYPEDPNHPPKEHHHDYKLLAEENKKTQPHKRQHKSKGEKNKRDSRIRKLSEQQPHPKVHKIPKLVKNKSIPLHSMEDQMMIKKKESQVEQKSFDQLNKERHFDVPEFGDGQMKLVACKEGCGRKYSQDRIWKHQGICMFMHKHKLFNIQDHRLTKQEKEEKKKLNKSKFSKKKITRNQPMMYNWRNKSSFLRALIRKNLKRQYKTFYDIKENCSREEWERTKQESACYKFWLNTINYRQGQKTIEQLKRENVFDVPEFVSNEELWMMQCREGCKRRFKLNCILSHEMACKRVFQTKRPVYDTRSYRMTAEQKKYAKMSDLLTRQEREQNGYVVNWKMKSQELWTDIKNSINTKFQTMYHFFFDTESEQKHQMKKDQSSKKQTMNKTEQKSQKPTQMIEKTEKKIQKTDPKSQKISESHQKPCQMTGKNCQKCKNPSQTCTTCQQTCNCQEPCECSTANKKKDQKIEKSVMTEKADTSNVPHINPKSEKKVYNEKTESTRPKAV